jgi:hypothetical protein
MKRLFVAAIVALVLVGWVGMAFAGGRDDGRSTRSRSSELRRRHTRCETRRRSKAKRTPDPHTRHRTRVYYFPSDYNGARLRAYNDASD